MVRPCDPWTDYQPSSVRVREPCRTNGSALMATLIDHQAKTRTEGTVSELVAIMVCDLMKVTSHRPTALRRYCESSVRAAIRRAGRTDANQELLMNPAEYNAWSAANPLPE